MLVQEKSGLAKEGTADMDWNPEILAEGLEFPEGPIAMGGGEVVFTEIRGQRLSRYKDGKVEMIAFTGGGANGATPGPDGAFYVTNNGGLCGAPPDHLWMAEKQIPGKIQRVTPEGEVSDLAVDLPGDPPHRPNDLCFGPDGLLYFTDPHNWEDIMNLKPGRVNRCGLDGKVEQIAEIKRFPNGIGFGLGDRLYIAESVTKKMWVCDLQPGGVSDPEEFCNLPTGYPDGFCFDTSGDLIVCGSGGDLICIFDTSGELKDRIDLPKGSEPTNCCIGDGKLYVTCSGTGLLAAIDYEGEALPLYPERAQESQG